MSGSSAAVALPVPTAGFNERKAKILQQLAVPDADYSDASPKGSVDEGIRPLLEHVNAAEGFVTTSSCAGRVSVFVEGRKAATVARAVAVGELDVAAAGGAAERLAGVGGKGGGGTWLYVSHEPHPKVGEDGVDWVDELNLGSPRGASQEGRGAHGKRLIHFKFEPMVSNISRLCHVPSLELRKRKRSNSLAATLTTFKILHVLTASYAHAQLLLRCALHAGFRESGAVSLMASSTPGDKSQTAMPMVAIRSMGLSFESLVGYSDDDGVEARNQLIVPPEYLDVLMRIGHERFAENTKRIERFAAAFAEAMRGPPPKKNPEGGAWEDAVARRERLKAEGLRRQAALNAEREAKPEVEEDEQ